MSLGSSSLHTPPSALRGLDLPIEVEFPGAERGGQLLFAFLICPGPLG